MNSSAENDKHQVGEPRQKNSRGDGPLYRQVAKSLKEDIVRGAFPVGAQLPTEDDLCKQFSVSRHTVREALRVLRNEGLVASRQGAGTVVIPPKAATSDIHQVMSINDLLAFASDARFDVDNIKMISVDAKLAQRTGLEAGEEWLAVRGYRLSRTTGEPLCWTEYYINRSYAAVGRILQRHTGPVFPLIEDMFGLSVDEVQQQISATLIGPRIAEGLGVKSGSAALEVRRTYRTNSGVAAQVTINTHPASRFQHSMTMRRVKT